MYKTSPDTNRRKYWAAAAVRQLGELDCVHCGDEIMSKIVAIFLSIDVNLYHAIIDWLSPSLGLQESRKFVTTLLKSQRCPYLFDIRKDAGIFFKSCSNSSSISDGGDDTIDNVIFICGDNQNTGGRIAATVVVGDRICLNSMSSSWWTVTEIKPAHGSVVMKRDPLKLSSSIMGDAKSLPTARVDVKQSVDSNEFKLIFFLGATVERKIVPQENIKLFVDYSELMDPMSSISIFFSLPSVKPEVALEQLRKLVQEQKMQRSMSTGIFALLPDTENEKKDPIRDMQNKMQVRVWLQHKENIAHAKSLLFEIDPYSAINREIWLLVGKALKIICRGESDLLSEFITWTSRGGEEGKRRSKLSAQAWSNLRPLTNCDHPALKKARVYLKSNGVDCSIAGTGKGTGKGSGSSVTPNHLPVNGVTGQVMVAYMKNCSPAIKAVLDSATSALEDEELIFYYDGPVENYGEKHGLNQTASKHKPDSRGEFREDRIQVPAIQYEVPNKRQLQLLSSQFRYQGESEELFNQKGQFVCSDEISGSISAGDIILLRVVEIIKYHAEVGSILKLSAFMRENNLPASDGSTELDPKQSKCYIRVHSVDLLFARLFVSLCAPPPVCWYDDSDEKFANDRFWVPVSCLWGVSTFRKQASKLQQRLQQDANNPDETLKYCVFVTPLPPAAWGLSLLGDIPNTSGLPLQPQLAVPPAKVAKPKLKTKKIVGTSKIFAWELMMQTLGILSNSIIITWNPSSIALVFEKKRTKPKTIGLKKPSRNQEATSTSSSLHPSSTPSFVFIVSIKMEDQESIEGRGTGGERKAKRDNLWREVYRGNGKGCQVSGLRELTSYVIRARIEYTEKPMDSNTKSSSNMRHSSAKAPSEDDKWASDWKYLTVLTTSSKPMRCPVLSGRWEPSIGSNSQLGSVKAQLMLAPSESLLYSYQNQSHPLGNDSIWRLPMGCCYRVEYISSRQHVEMVAKSFQNSHTSPEIVSEFEATVDWKIATESTSPVVWVGGPWEGCCLVFRHCVVNQQGRCGPYSDVFVVQVPLLAEICGENPSYLQLNKRVASKEAWIADSSILAFISRPNAPLFDNRASL